MLNYPEFFEYTADLAAKHGTSGLDQTDEQKDFTQLNYKRMERWNKTFHVSADTQNILDSLTSKQKWYVITETWCGDAAQVVPVINKMAEVSSKIDLKILFRDENEDVMNMFLTNGTKSIPKLIIIEKKSGEVIADFGPRPQGAKQLILDYKATHGVVDETAKINLQKWYLADKGVATQEEIVEIMKIKKFE